MIKYHADTTINQPAESIFRYVTDPTKWPEWTEMDPPDVLYEGEMQVGSQVKSHLNMGPKSVDLVFEVIEMEPNRKAHWKTINNGPIQWDAIFLFEPDGGSGTHVTTFGELRFGGLLRLLEPFMAGEVRAQEAKELVTIKTILEGAE
jgi:uncharacterized protein YndB with AHSA1/START domain